MNTTNTTRRQLLLAGFGLVGALMGCGGSGKDIVINNNFPDPSPSPSPTPSPSPSPVVVPSPSPSPTPSPSPSSGPDVNAQITAGAQAYIDTLSDETKRQAKFVADYINGQVNGRSRAVPKQGSRAFLGLDLLYTNGQRTISCAPGVFKYIEFTIINAITKKELVKAGFNTQRTSTGIVLGYSNDNVCFTANGIYDSLVVQVANFIRGASPDISQDTATQQAKYLIGIIAFLVILNAL